MQGQSAHNAEREEAVEQISSGEEDAAGAHSLASDLAVDLGTPAAARWQSSQHTQQPAELAETPHQHTGKAQLAADGTASRAAGEGANSDVTPGRGISAAQRFFTSHMASTPKGGPRRRQVWHAGRRICLVIEGCCWKRVGLI